MPTNADWISLLFSFLFVLLLLAGVLYGLRRWSSHLGRGHSGGGLVITDSLMLNTRYRLVLVNVRNRDVLLAIGPQGVTSLGVFDSVAAQPPAASASPVEKTV